MQIRLLQPADVKIYHALRLEGLQDSPQAFGSTYEEEANQSLENVAKKLQSDETFGAFVLGAFAPDGQLVGLLGLEREKGVKYRHKAWLWGMYVTPKFRRQGISRALVHQAIARARRVDGLEQLILGLYSGQTAAQRLYEALGFKGCQIEEKSVRHNGIDYDLTRMKFYLR